MASSTLFLCCVGVVFLVVNLKMACGETGKKGLKNKPYNWFKGIEEWDTSKEIKGELPAYQAGWDYEGRPVYVTEFGKWDVRKFLESGKPEDKELVYNRIEKIWYIYSIPYPQSNSSEEGAVLIIDGKGLTAYQLASAGAVTYQLSSLRIGESFETHFVDIFIVNVNFVVQSWINLMRPVAGRLIGRAVIISSNPEKIGATLREKIPRDQLPPWLGGSEGFKPVRVF